MNPTNPSVQDPNDILTQIQNLGAQLGNVAIPTPTIPALGFTAPSGADIDAKWKEFLDRASKDPDIVRYYNNLLEQAKGDTNLAKSFLERDYQMGVRHTTENLKGSLKSLGLTFGHEQQTLEDTLNKRGIALTQDGNKLTYAGGGQSATELGQLNESQKLRQEAEQRSARQGIEKAGISREKGLTSAGQQLQQTAQSLQQGKQQDILGRAGTYYGIYQGQQAANLARSQMEQQRKMQESAGQPAGFQPTDEWAHANTGMSLANYYKSQGR